MICGIDKSEDDLTYVEHYPPCRASTLSYIYSARVRRMRDDGEDFTLNTDWGTMLVSGFESFAAGFSEGMTGERSRVRLGLAYPLGEGKLPCLEELLRI